MAWAQEGIPDLHEVPLEMHEYQQDMFRRP
jgi:hypothetical protein